MENEEFTLGDLLNREHELVLTAMQENRYFIHAENMVTLLNNVVHTVDRPLRIFFFQFLSQVRNHLTLALFSNARLHYVQAGMNLRQVLEAGAWAAYGMAHEESTLFYTEQDGRITTPENLSRARNTWLNTNYPEKSETIRNLKNNLNESVAHSNVTYTTMNFGFNDGVTPGFITSFFDSEDGFQMNMGLLATANFAMGMIDLFVTINQNEHVFQTPEGFAEQFINLVQEHNSLRREMENHPRLRQARQ